MITLEEIKSDPIHKRLFISDEDGGLNPCWNVKKHNDSLGRKTEYYDTELTALANCTAWAIGRFNMLIGFDYIHFLSATDASNFINIAKKKGLTVTQQPVIGGVMVWDDGKSGHVEVVEEMSADGNICYDSSSGYGLYILAKKTRKRNTGGINQWGFKAPTKYLGCINPPICKSKQNHELKVGCEVSIKPNATYYTGRTIPNWVKSKAWIVKSISGDRVVIDKSADGKYSICSAINKKYLIVK